ncbi:RNA helicase, partial [Reticulomyxa filosa]
EFFCFVFSCVVFYFVSFYFCFVLFYPSKALVRNKNHPTKKKKKKKNDGNTHFRRESDVCVVLVSYGPTSLPAAHSYPFPSSTSSGYSASLPSSAASAGFPSTDYRFHPYANFGQASSSGAHNNITRTDSTSTSTGSAPTIPPPPGFGYGTSSSHGYGGHFGSSANGSTSRYNSSTHHSQSASFLYDRRDSNNRFGMRKMAKNEFGILIGQPGCGLRKIDWSKEDLPQFRKNFYREHPSIGKTSDTEVQQWRLEHDIQVIGPDIPKPIRTFEQAGEQLNQINICICLFFFWSGKEYIMSEIRRAGFQKPTPIQAQGWPMAMSGRDVIGIAKTGSGKTLAFMLPSIIHINAQPLLRKGDGPIVLVIAPTRELALQIELETQKFAYSSKIKHTCTYGGIPRREQAIALQQGVEICICTPGRLLDFLESGTTNLLRVTYLVIDEADRLLDMGFEPQLKAIFSQVRPDRQVLMWSATWPKEVRQLAAEFMSSDTIQVSVGSWETKANHDVQQIIEVISPDYKSSRLCKVIQSLLSEKKSKILVFVATKRGCDELYRRLTREGWAVTGIHGGKEQMDRDRALDAFKTGRSSILVATDVAARGIHVDDITHVINYDFPMNIEDYVHRIGRTGRVGKKGTAISFFTKDDAKRAQPLIGILEEAHQFIPKELREMQLGGRTRESKEMIGLTEMIVMKETTEMIEMIELIKMTEMKGMIETTEVTKTIRVTETIEVTELKELIDLNEVIELKEATEMIELIVSEMTEATGTIEMKETIEIVINRAIKLQKSCEFY